MNETNDEHGEKNGDRGELTRKVQLEVEREISDKLPPAVRHLRRWSGVLGMLWAFLGAVGGVAAAGFLTHRWLVSSFAQASEVKDMKADVQEQRKLLIDLRTDVAVIRSNTEATKEQVDQLRGGVDQLRNRMWSNGNAGARAPR